MIQLIKEDLWKQFGASIDMLINAIELYPEDYWYDRKKFFYIAYHTSVFLDYYLTFPAADISSPLPFTITENIPDGALDDLVPDAIYSKAQVLDFLQASRTMCHTFISGLTETLLAERWIETDGGKNMSVFELMLYNMRHVQHHAAQLNMLLRAETNTSANWLRKARE